MNTTKLKFLIHGCAKGVYQADLLSGSEAWSGATLRGEARHWGSQYAKSRRSLIERINMTLSDGWRVTTDIVDRRRELLIINPQGITGVFDYD